MGAINMVMTMHRTIRGLAFGAAALLAIAATPLAAATDDDSFFTHLHTE